MNGQSGTLGLFARHLALAVQPLRNAVSSVERFRALMLRLGWGVTDMPPEYGDLAATVDQALAALEALGEDPEPAEVVDLLERVAAVYRAVDGISTAPPGVDAEEFLADFADRLFELLLVDYLAEAVPMAFNVLSILGVVERQYHRATATRPSFIRNRLRLEVLGEYFDDPPLLLTRVYGWGSDDLRFDRIARHGAELMLALGINGVALTRLDQAASTAFQAETDPEEVDELRSLEVEIFRTVIGDTVVVVGFQVSELPPEAGMPAGLIVEPLLPPELGGATPASAPLEFPMGDRVVARLRAGTDLSKRVGLVLRPGSAEVRYPFAPGQPLPPAGFGVAFAFTPPTPMTLLGAPGGSRLDVRRATASFELDLREGELEAVAAVSADDVVVALAASDFDGFLNGVLGGRDLVVPLKLRVAWSNHNGLRVNGGTGFEVGINPRLSVGPVRIDEARLALRSNSDNTRPPDLQIEASAAVSGTLGPFAFSLAGMGVGVSLRFEPGNAGPLDLDAGFVPPTGMGLRIDSGSAGITGGGFLSFDPDRREYAGALELQFGKIGVKAIGVLTTGPGGWSLILLLHAQIPPIQLAFGFVLDGIGGLIGLQRAVDVTQLISGMKTGALDDILFPANPVGDAPRILERLRTAFPARPRSLTIGPMVKGGWGSPRIVFVRLAVLVQLDNALGPGGGPVALTRVVVIGQLRVAIAPSEDDPDLPLVLLIVDIVGSWEVADQRFGFLAALRDSRIATIDISGGVGVWGEFGAQKRFLLAAGGFNARFQDVPSEMSRSLSRLRASFSVGRFDLVLTGYFALTPATIQAGLNLAATAKIGSVGLRGEIGFEVLIYRRPHTHFIADFHIVAEVTYRGRSLAGVKVNGTIEGPGRWHVTGKVTFSILWWDISKSFDESWGSLGGLVLGVVDVGALLGAALAKAENWSAQLPAGVDAMVTLAPPRGAVTPRAHPLGRFVFSQSVTPLGVTLEKYGDSAVTGPNRFDIAALTVGGRSVTNPSPVREHFARAQFLEMTDEERLTRPSFEAMDAGVEFSSESFEVSAQPPVLASMRYETAYLDLETQETRRDETLETVAVDHDVIDALAYHGAAARAPQRWSEQMRAKTHLRLTMSASPVVVADRETLSPVVMGGSQAGANQVIAEQSVRDVGMSNLQVVEAFELADA